MKSDVYQKTINDFIKLGRSIPKLDDLILRGTCIDQNHLIEGWSDLDMSIVVKALDQENISEIKNFIQHLKSSNDFKISITVVTSDDFNSFYHYHGMKPLYYSYEIKKDHPFNETHTLKLPDYFKENLLLYDCTTNLAYLIHDLRNGYFSCGSSLEQMSTFTRHLVKRSKFILKNAFFALNQKIEEDFSTPKLLLFFPLLTERFLDIIQNTKKNWTHLSQDHEKLQHILFHAFEQVNYIYETTLRKFNEKEKKEAQK